MSITNLNVSPVVKVAGAALSAEQLAEVREVRVELELNAPGRAELRFRDEPDSTALTQLTIGSALSVSDPAGSTALFTGEITSLTTEASARTGEMLLVVVAHDKSHRMTKAMSIATYHDLTVADLVSRLANEYSLRTSIDAPEVGTFSWTSQADSDMGLLQELARHVGCDWWVAADGVLHFAKPTSATDAPTLTYGESLLEFSMRLTGDIPTKVTVNGWDVAQQQTIVGEAQTPSTGVWPSIETTAETLSRTYGKPLTTAGTGRPWDQQEAKVIAQAVLDRTTGSAVSVRGTCTDFMALALGGWVELKGVGARCAGKYPVTRVEHAYRSGLPLSTRFAAGDRSSRALADTLTGAAAAGRAGWRHDGVVVGVITKNTSSENAGGYFNGRVKVKLPTFNDSYESSWARVLTSGGGADRGSFFHPEVGDEVLVAFEGGDLRQPVVLGGLHSEQAAYLADLVADQKVKARTIKSRAGHLISITEGGGADKAAILLQLNGGQHKVYVGEDKVTVECSDGKAIEVVSGSSSIKIAESTGDITVQATGKLTLKSDQEIDIAAPTVKISADAQLSMQSSAVAELKAEAELQLQASGPASLKGAIVQLN